ncbi:class C sortase [Enterococcus timonensis]|uniref:class C sortase n=1 Tax=Enterococcus timonensis TaxID=1852364 RepID=UPI0008D9988D|nr:class C sortase [Enterococcus timonensis]
MKFLKRHYKNIILSVVFLIGLGIFTYPFYQDALQKAYDQYLISQFQKENAQRNEEELVALQEKFAEENKRIAEENARPADTEFLAEETVVDVEPTLDFFEERTLAILTIPSIKGEMPVFDTGTDAFLNRGAAHLYGSSLPTGGLGNHAVIMAHRGMPEAELFSKLPQVEEDDVFFLEVAGEKLAYQVDQIKIIEPTDVDDLLRVEGKDYVTLMTCTPYMVNSHRLLVRGVRIPYTEEHEILQAGMGNHKLWVIILTIVGILAAISLGLWWINKKNKNNKNGGRKNVHV